MIEHILEFDEGLFEMINFLSAPYLDQNAFEATFNQTYSIELTDGTIYNLIPDGQNVRVTFQYILNLLSCV
jgi:hypothetical protein